MAAGVLTAIDRTEWDVIPLGITHDGQWVRVADDPSALEFKDGKGQCVTAGSTRVVLTPDEGNLVGLSYDGDPDTLDSRAVGIEDLGHVGIVFPLLHSPYGEDGTTQGLFEMVGARCVGYGVTSSAVSMDRHLTKTVLATADTDVGRWELVTARQWGTGATACIDRIEGLGFPVFVKPYRAGSSVGISRVTCRENLPVAIKETASRDPRIIIEIPTSDRKVKCGALGSHSDWRSGTASLSEIVIPEGEFYDYEYKYVDNTTGLSYSVGATPEYTGRTRATAWRAFDALRYKGLTRVDFFFDKATGSVIINGVNTTPGLTPVSMYPQMRAASGLSCSDLLNELFTEADERPLGSRRIQRQPR